MRRNTKKKRKSNNNNNNNTVHGDICERCALLKYQKSHKMY